MSTATPIASSAFDRITDALHRFGSKQAGKMWSCPAHEDRTPSLSVTADDGRAWVKCFAECRDVDVLRALGLDVPDLFDEPRVIRDKPHAMEKRASRPPKKAKKKASAKPLPIVSLDEVRRIYGKVGLIVEEYPYDDEQRCEVLRVFRIQTDDEGGKTFRQATPEGNGWKLSTQGTRLVPFHLPELLAAIPAGDTVYIVEGEKDVLAVEAAGGVATCNVGGAGKPLEEYAQHFKGAALVRIVADQDDVGRKHARAWAKALRGIVGEFEIVDPVEGKDAHDSLVLHGHGLADAFRPVAERDEDDPHEADHGPKAVQLSMITPEPIEWLWPGYIPKGKITDVVGDGDMGKSLVMLDITARETTGRPMPSEPETKVREPRNVVLLIAEDDLNDTVVPRLIAAGADMKRVFAFTDGISFPNDLGRIEDLIRRTEAALLIIDPVMSFLGDNVKSGIDSSVRKHVGGPLKGIAARHGCSILSLRHVNKNEGASTSNRGGGSVGFRNVARAALAFGPDRDDETEQRRYMAQSKKNLGRQAVTLAYRIESSLGRVDVEGEDGTPIVIWEGPAHGVTVADLLGPEPKERGPREGTKTKSATEWLQNRLTGGVAEKAAEVEAVMIAAGFTKKVIEAAKKYAGVKSERISIGNKGEGYSLWTIT